MFRRQFPPVPASSPVLPSWQLPSSGDNTSKDSVTKDTLVTMATDPSPGSPTASTKETTDEQQIPLDTEKEVLYLP